MKSESREFHTRTTLADLLARETADAPPAEERDRPGDKNANDHDRLGYGWDREWSASDTMEHTPSKEPGDSPDAMDYDANKYAVEGLGTPSKPWTAMRVNISGFV